MKTKQKIIEAEKEPNIQYKLEQVTYQENIHHAWGIGKYIGMGRKGKPAKRIQLI